MPMSTSYQKRLSKILPQIVENFGTPFHIYDEKGIKETCEKLSTSFKNIDGFKEFFAVKALPNPSIMKIMQEMGFGFDCSSTPEIQLSRQIGSFRDDIMFTSNNTSMPQFETAIKNGGCILNLDDISLISKLIDTPDLICFRYNPGLRRNGNKIIGNPVESKYGVSHDQILDAYTKAKKLGVKRFGIHTMLASNELDYKYMVETTQMLLGIVELVCEKLDITFEFINIGGGLGIPYTPEAQPFDLDSMAKEIALIFKTFKKSKGWVPKLYMESGRYITGPHGVLVTSVINHKNTYRKYVGVDASMSSLMRPGMYDAYHHIHIHGKKDSVATGKVDVVGALCENIDKFAVQRSLPDTIEGDILVIHDTGAHGHAMGFNYNGHLRPKELLLKEDSSVELIRRAETMDDYFSTLTFEPKKLKV
ncbi:MAG: diaminopimelate decarboxylase [Desulfobacula sp.]|jgi:diaminopimelate decarboxylase|uniref:diaminopimelate decarboxylase n=1 Tax=Desulfobacula sp. TaxID=2593537 RepID=UPI001DF36E0E|nr:diaminopimelate decarboxylase [Desulfobacula sp.]MBT3485005.1 diaminopimelate decarboxylase [Desulfobacula sp.]MBT3804178.1 diaminopimelate decarboxylase [Desulfobacula sp.]MBT4025034.1 diaminopimelate decarboxylase [Desulfobacula sp.]MBT4198656.1 diaminopimelate decarboxylase [Desulfobacula sp.]